MDNESKSPVKPIFIFLFILAVASSIYFYNKYQKASGAASSKEAKKIIKSVKVK